MEKTESTNSNPKRRGLSIQELKKVLGLDKIHVHQPIKVKKDGKHLYYVAGYTLPLRWETIERLNIPNQRIIEEVDREEWNKERLAAQSEQNDNIDADLYPFDYE